MPQVNSGSVTRESPSASTSRSSAAKLGIEGRKKALSPRWGERNNVGTDTAVSRYRTRPVSIKISKAEE